MVIARGNVSFSVDFEYENAPSFCGSCHQIGHLTANCRRFAPGDDRNKSKEKSGKTNGPIGNDRKSEWVSRNNKKLLPMVMEGSSKISEVRLQENGIIGNLEEGKLRKDVSFLILQLKMFSHYLFQRKIRMMRS